MAQKTGQFAPAPFFAISADRDCPRKWAIIVERTMLASTNAEQRRLVTCNGILSLFSILKRLLGCSRSEIATIFVLCMASFKFRQHVWVRLMGGLIEWCLYRRVARSLYLVRERDHVSFKTSATTYRSRSTLFFTRRLLCDE